MFFLLGTFLLTALSGAFRKIHRRGSEKVLETVGKRFFYRPLHAYFFPEKEFEGIFFAVTSAQNSTRFFYAASAIAFLYSAVLAPHLLADRELHSLSPMALIEFLLLLSGFLMLSFLFGDYIPRIFALHYPEKAIETAAPASSIFLLLSFPFSYLFLKLGRLLSHSLAFDHLHPPDTQAKQEIIEIIQESQLSEELDETEKKLLRSLLSFCEHLTREVMIPRVDVFLLEAKTTMREAARVLEAEGYSRVPVYEENIDNIVGILMHKDLLSKYLEYERSGNDPTILDAPISSLLKPPLFTPETKHISDLLQEFRKKQTHLAIVIDEYGGTEGIVSIEDILEDIVGEIADEYDEEEELFLPESDGSWLVDPRMSLLDVEEQLGVKIPQDGDYDTIGGYIFHCAGEIPEKGFKVESDEFEIEVLLASERSVERVRISPRSNIGDE